MTQDTKYAIHILEMIRNNGIEHEKEQHTECFFMFDYFDVLYHKELIGEEKGYENYLNVKDLFASSREYKVSNKVLSLYQRKQKIEVNPFEIYTGDGLSDLPFIGIVQITLCKENYKERPEDIEVFIDECEKKILKIVDDELQQDIDKIAKKQLYRSSTTGDFCLVVRASSVEDIYHIALRLNDTQHRKSDDIKLFTYTNVGMECRIGENQQYCTLSDAFVTEHSNLSFALRISADTYFKEQLEEYVKSNQNQIQAERVKGLFGRYDYLLHVNVKEFAQIYPLLCEKKLGSPQKNRQKNPKTENQGNERQDNEKNVLVDIIRNSNMQNINERILVNVSGLKSIDKESIGNSRKEAKRIIKKNNEMFNKIDKLWKWKGEFVEEYREFKELFRYMQEICKIFLPIGLEKDAYINWVIFYQDMETLINCIEQEMEEYKKDTDCSSEERDKKRINILSSWRTGVHAINQYTRLVQNVNYQTYQAPTYEMQTQIDTEKTLVAYREVMENYMALYYDYMKEEDRRESIRTIIYPDMEKGDVEVKGQFSEQISSKAMKKAIVCTVPSFEYFGRLYDLLPWLLHECSHHIRVLQRDVRNTFVVETAFRYIFRIIIHSVFEQLSNSMVYEVSSVWSKDLIEAMVEVAVKQIYEEENIDEYNFEQVALKMGIYLDRLVEEKYTVLKERETRKKDTAKIKQKVVEELLKCGIQSGIADEEYLKLLEKVKCQDDSLQPIQDVVSCLLESYENELKEQVGSKSIKVIIKIDDFMLPIDEFDEKILSMSDGIDDDIKDFRSYSYKIKALYRNYKAYIQIKSWSAENSLLDRFLEEVFEAYRVRMKNIDAEFIKRRTLIEEPETVFILRNLGLLNMNKTIFCEEVKKVFQGINGKDIQQAKIACNIFYRETCADLFMANSLQMDGFAYCRQVLFTISDAQIGTKMDLYNSINPERFRMVTAVLLKKEGVTTQTNEITEEVHVNAASIIEKSKIYAEYTIKCIRERVKEDKKLTEKQKKRLNTFVSIIYNQVALCIDTPAIEVYYDSYLFVLLHNMRDKVSSNVLEEIQGFEDIIQLLKDYLHLFTRLEILVLGLEQILTGSEIIVPKSKFEHMWSVYEQSSKEGVRGCKWEEMLPEYLAESKLNVGKFYKEPQQVQTLSSEEKLENTIDFIQNYYYNNRFRVMEVAVI